MKKRSFSTAGLTRRGFLGAGSTGLALLSLPGPATLVSESVKLFARVIFGFSLAVSLATAQAGPNVVLWKDRKATSFLVLPSSDERASGLVRSTFSYNLARFYGLQLPVANGQEKAGTYVVLGTPANN